MTNDSPDAFERWPELDGLFERALEVPRDRRAALLDEACGGHAALRHELEALLAAHDASGDFLADAEAWLGERPAQLSPAAARDRWVGKTLSHYEVIERLGEGGMGVVYRARDTRLARTVALKFIHPMLSAEAEAKSRFTQEARAASALDHPNICTIYEIDETPDGQLFIVMAYYAGETLADRLKRGPLSVAEALDMAVAIGSGLARAHEVGIVHRDLNPANVMLTERGEPKILDFGIAKLEGGDQTRTGTRLGTAAYMSPEQARGEPVDRRTDIWALGAVLYEMLTGERAFHGGNETATIYAILNQQPGRIAGWRKDVPAGLEDVVRRALAKNSADRYAGIDAMLGDLRAVHDQPTAKAAGATRSRRIRRTALWLGGGTIAVAAAVIATLTLGSDAPAGPAEPAAADPVLALPTGPSIAVIPFANQSDDPEDVFFSDGLSDDIVAALSRFTDLFVISLGSTARYKGQPVDLTEVRRDLGVDYVLQGAVRRSPSRIRVTAQLANAATGASVWSNAFELDPTVADLYDAQDRITEQVAGEIGGSTGVIARSRITQVRDRPTESMAAYECVLRASEYIIDHGARNHLLARDCLENAITRDSSYADAWGWLSYLYAEESRHGWNRRPDEYDPIERALLAGRRAVSIDPASYIGYFGLAVTYFDAHDLEAFRAAGERAVELNPNDANTLAIVGDYLSEMGDYERGQALLRKSMALNPDHPGWMYTSFFLSRYEEGDYEGALFEARRFNMPDSYRGPFLEAAALGQLGRVDEATVVLHRLQALRPDFVSIEALRRQLASYNHPPETAEHLLDGLRKAGLPERDP